MNRQWILLALATMCAQAAGLQFDVTSVKPAANKGGGGPGPGFSPPSIQMGAGTGGRFVSQGLPLRALILLAYGIQDYQLSGGPDWLMSERYDVEARPEAGMNPTEAQTREMLQALLADRFGLKVRRDTKTGPIMALTLAKGGAKLKLSADQTPLKEGEGALPGPLAEGPGTLMALGLMGGAGGPGGRGPGSGGPGGPGGGGGPAFGGPGGGGPGGGRGPGGGGPGAGGPGFVGGLRGISMAELNRGAMFTGPDMVLAKAVPVEKLVKPIENELRKTVVNRTGLTGLYDIEMRWTPTQMAEMLRTLPADVQLPPGIADGPTLTKALQDQLGLKLEQSTGPVEAIVIEKVEKPEAN